MFCSLYGKSGFNAKGTFSFRHYDALSVMHSEGTIMVWGCCSGFSLIFFLLPELSIHVKIRISNSDVMNTMI